MKPEVVIFEGPDASGKTFLINKLCTYLDHKGEKYVRTRMIGGTPIGEMIRNLVVSKDYSILPATQLLLIAAARMEALYVLVYDELAKGNHVIIDRWDLTASIYQMYKFIDAEKENDSKMSISTFTMILETTRRLTQILHDRVTTVILDASDETMDKRLVMDQRLDERFKGSGTQFMQSVRNHYREIAKNPFGSGLSDHILAFNHDTHFTFKTSSIISENVKQWLIEATNTMG